MTPGWTFRTKTSRATTLYYTTAHFEVEKQGTLRIQLNFSENLANTTYVIFYAEFEKVLEITKAREVLA